MTNQNHSYKNVNLGNLEQLWNKSEVLAILDLGKIK